MNELSRRDALKMVGGSVCFAGDILFRTNENPSLAAGKEERREPFIYAPSEAPPDTPFNIIFLFPPSSSKFSYIINGQRFPVVSIPQKPDGTIIDSAHLCVRVTGRGGDETEIVVVVDVPSKDGTSVAKVARHKITVNNSVALKEHFLCLPRPRSA